MDYYPVKITVLVERDVYVAMQKTIPFGFRRHLVSAVLRLVTGAIRREGNIMLGAIIAGNYRLVPDLDKKEDESAKT